MPLVHLMVSDDAMRCVDSEAVVFTSKGKSQLLITSITDALLRVTSTLFLPERKDDKNIFKSSTPFENILCQRLCVHTRKICGGKCNLQIKSACVGIHIDDLTRKKQTGAKL